MGVLWVLQVKWCVCLCHPLALSCGEGVQVGEWGLEYLWFACPSVCVISGRWSTSDLRVRVFVWFQDVGVPLICVSECLCVISGRWSTSDLHVWVFVCDFRTLEYLWFACLSVCVWFQDVGGTSHLQVWVFVWFQDVGVPLICVSEC